jgi:UDP-glucose 4-epimerase
MPTGKRNRLKRILVTGGLGYIGSHTCLVLCGAGYTPIVLDNLVNSKLAVLEWMQELAGGQIEFHHVDVRDRAALDHVFSAQRVEAVIHLAGLKAVGESVEKPLLYYDNNVGGAVALLEVMTAHRVQRLVFSSSATVYGEPERLPLAEDHPLRPESPYGRTKLVVERLLGDRSTSDQYRGGVAEFKYVALRYFNPVGAHPSGRIGEDPRGIPNNLLPCIAQVAVGKLPKLRVFGNDYPTRDGTGVRDYIHVVDLARGHLAALAYLERSCGSLVVNLGTGRGYSVLEAVKAFERASGRKIPLDIVARRPGDVAECYADASLAARELGWKPKLSIDDMCADAWRWQSMNPSGYPETGVGDRRRPVVTARHDRPSRPSGSDIRPDSPQL